MEEYSFNNREVNLQDMLIELYEISLTPMRPQNSPLSSLASLNSKEKDSEKFNSLENLDVNPENDIEILSKQFIILLERSRISNNFNLHIMNLITEITTFK